MHGRDLTPLLSRPRESLFGPGVNAWWWLAIFR
jgi:hypothetical protein